MNHKHVGWGLIVVGGLVQIAESSAQSSAALNNTQFSASQIGAIVTPIENYLPIQLGWTLVISGVLVLFVLPMISKG